jgi:rSAM/selenodomain-associated transferase 1
VTPAVLDPTRPHSEFTGKCALVIMAKAPRPGRVKTRLTPPLTPEQAATLHTCFLRDTAQNVSDVAVSNLARGVVSYTPVGDEHVFDGLLPESFVLIPQRGDDFGARLLASVEDLLHCGFDAVCLIDSDSPTLPAEFLERAVTSLERPGDRVVLGPCDDGGYYLIGVKAAHAALFSGIPWSTPQVYKRTVAAALSASLDIIELPIWYDVDDAETLEILRQELLEGVAPAFSSAVGYSATHSRESLNQLSGVSK